MHVRLIVEVHQNSWLTAIAHAWEVRGWHRFRAARLWTVAAMHVLLHLASMQMLAAPDGCAWKGRDTPGHCAWKGGVAGHDCGQRWEAAMR